MSQALIPVLLFLAFLAICVMAGEILIRARRMKWRGNRRVGPLTPHDYVPPWHVYRHPVNDWPVTPPTRRHQPSNADVA